jgi:hypothetical protein
LIFYIPFTHRRYCEKIPYWLHASFTLLYITCSCYCDQFTKTNGVIWKQIINYRRWKMHVTWSRMVISKVTAKSTKCLWKTKILYFLPENRGPKYTWWQCMHVRIWYSIPGLLYFSLIKHQNEIVPFHLISQYYTVEPRSIVPVSIVFPHSSFAIFGPE